MLTKMITIDLETIPPGKLEDYELKKSPPKTMKKEDTIAKWREEEREKEFRAQALDPMSAQIICAGIAVENYIQDDIENDDSVEYKMFYGEDEEKIIREISSYLKEKLVVENNDNDINVQYNVKWLGCNVRSFDLEIIWLRAIKYKEYFLSKLISRRRYDNSVIDIIEIMSGATMKFYSFDKISKFLGLAGKTEGIDGSKVYDEYLAGNLESRIVPYCQRDVEGNREIYKRIQKGLNEI